jgi:hypothetical protein
MYYELLEVEGEKSLQGYLAQSQYEENRPEKKAIWRYTNDVMHVASLPFAVQLGTLPPWMLC